MKLVNLSALSAFALLSTLPAFAAGAWQTVLRCDDGAATVENISGYGRGGEGLAARVVIRDGQIVSYFSQNHAGGNFAGGQWSGQSFFQPFMGGTPSNQPLLSFQAFGIVVQANGSSLTVTSGGANWTFRNCSSN